MRLQGPWQSIVKRCMSDASLVKMSAMYPPEIDLEGIDEWPNVLLKMQRAKDADPDEDYCHHLVTRKCPDISPRFLFGITIAGVRISFMEWLDNCASMYDLRKEKSPMLNNGMATAIQSCIKDMWLKAGVLHCDMHLNNVLVSRDTKKVYIIDYGMAMQIDDAMRDDLIQALENKRMRPAHAFDKFCKDHALKVILRRGYNIDDMDDWNDDASFLRLLASTYCRRRTK
ncbi:hypothetical protein TSOC_014867 [Tetrabaena socialis]|uniref:Protein kinase domain-containing protein n=1 Tax=Tetrabaena socialis TaxID=47790 RepID=A0A2J7ZGG5_9CHLO|nr:hypothetical protein TSOC_014867 [Tetrabaena socialis]|eukprot:PNG99364.1 hypothetical protein TSOC_014867 [Tetrabaena socialis]